MGTHGQSGSVEEILVTEIPTCAVGIFQKGERVKNRLAKEISRIALAVALLSVSAWIAVPFGAIPVTLQTLCVLFTAGYLGAKRGALAVTAYLLLGAAGVPVFSSFTGGVNVFLSPTGGFLLGLLPTAVLMGAFKGKKSFWRNALGGAAATLLLYVCGVIGFAIHTSFAGGVWAAIVTCVLPFVPFDVGKIFLAALLLTRI